MREDLARRLAKDLPDVAAGEDTLYFYNHEHDPFELTRLMRLSRRGGEAYALASDIAKLAAKLGDGDDANVESLLLDAVRGHSDLGDEQRLGSSRLAEELLRRIDALGKANT
jgi:hypothetical protein